MTPSQKKTINKQTNNNLIEQLKGIGGGVTKTIGKDLIGGVSNDILSSLFGTPKSGELTPNKPVNLDQKDFQFNEQMPTQPERKPVNLRSPFQNEILNLLKQEQTQVSQQINEIRLELKALIAAVNNVSREMEMAVKEEVIDPSVYHLSFLDRLKTLLKLMRKNLNNSATWLACMRSRKKERKYWNMYKKKGTQFGLSSERSTATQTS